MSVTIKKIAQLAGVSTGTVDRALHDRGRVNPQVAQRIRQIAEELNYQPNAVAKSLSIRSRKLKIAVILHIETSNAFFDDVIAGILRGKEEIRDFGIAVELYRCANFDPVAQLALIEKALEDGASAIAIVPIHDARVQQRLDALTAEGFPVVFLTNIIENANYLSFVGCDYRLAGKITAGLLNLLQPQGGRLLLFSPSFQMYGHTLRAQGLQTQLETEYPAIALQRTVELTGDDIRDYQITRAALEEFPETDLIVCPGASGSGNLQAMADLGYFGRAKIVCYDYSEKIDAMIRSGRIQASITQCPQEQGYLAVRTLFDYLSAGKMPAFPNNYVRMRILLKENLSEIARVRAEYHQGAVV